MHQNGFVFSTNTNNSYEIKDLQGNIVSYKKDLLNNIINV